MNWLGGGIERAGIALDYADSALNTVGNTLLVLSAAALLFDPEPFSKGGIGIGGGALGLSAKGVRYAVVGAKLGLDFFKGSRWVYSGYRTATTAQSALKVMKWGNDRISKNQLENPGGSNLGNGGEKETISGNNQNAIIDKLESYLGKDFKVFRPKTGSSDFIARSADGTKQIRFDISDPHGLKPHINLEKIKPRNLYPGDTKTFTIDNIHIFPGGK